MASAELEMKASTRFLRLRSLVWSASKPSKDVSAA